MHRWPLQRDTLSYGFIWIPGKAHKSPHHPTYVCPTPSLTSCMKRLFLSLWSRCTYGCEARGQGTLTALFLSQKTENPSQEIPQPGSPLLQEEISISLKIFYFFYPLQLQIVTKYRNSCSHTNRASPNSCSFAICSCT